MKLRPASISPSTVRRILRLLGAVSLVAVAGGLLLERGSRDAGREPGRGADLRRLAELPVSPALDESRAVACLVTGDATRSLDALPPEEWDALVRAVALVLAAYEHADFGAFVALRAADVAHAESARAADVAELRRLVDGASPRGSAGKGEAVGGWLATLEAFWARLYAVPPVSRFRVEASRCRTGTLRPAREDLERWEAAFDARLAALGPHVVLYPAVPHRRGVEEIAARLGSLRFVDLELPFDGTASVEAFSSGGTLVVRLVRDAGAEWFVHRAGARCVGAPSGPPVPCRFLV